MKVGDLVTLSAYGRKRNRASWIQHDDVGLIISIKQYSHHYADDYTVQWIKSEYRNTWSQERTNHRKDLRYVK